MVLGSFQNGFGLRTSVFPEGKALKPEALKP